MAAAGFSALVTAVVDNVGVSFEWIILLIFIVANIIFFARDFKIGIITLMITMAGVFVWFYQANYNWVLPLSVFFISLVILSLTLFAVNKSSATGGFT